MKIGKSFYVALLCSFFIIITNQAYSYNIWGTFENIRESYDNEQITTRRPVLGKSC